VLIAVTGDVREGVLVSVRVIAAVPVAVGVRDKVGGPVPVEVPDPVTLAVWDGVIV